MIVRRILARSNSLRRNCLIRSYIELGEIMLEKYEVEKHVSYIKNVIEKELDRKN